MTYLCLERLPILVCILFTYCICELYTNVKAKHGEMNNVIYKKENVHSKLTCLHICQLRKAGIIFQHGVCYCVKEDDDKETNYHNEKVAVPSSATIWRKLDTTYNKVSIDHVPMGEESFCGERNSSNITVPKDKWILIATAVCYKGKGSGYGSFKLQRHGILLSVRLEHISGLITCNRNDPTFGSSIWTCADDNTQLSSFITDDNDKIIFPPGVTLYAKIDKIMFEDKSVYEMTSQFLTYNSPVMKVVEGTEFRIWNANDLGGGELYDQNNDGEHCVNVYGNFTT